MSIPVRVPSASEDRPRWAVLAGIAVSFLAIGIALARWGTYGGHTADGDGASSPPSTAEPATATETDEAEPEVTETEVAETEVAETEAEPEVAETEGEIAETERAVVATPTPTASGTSAGTASATEPTTPRATATAAPPRTTGAGMRVVRGRVAYLRCDGVPQQSGPTPCPRDEALEAAAWGALDALGECATLPAAEGEADLVLDFASATAEPEVRTRDRFASDVTRLDAEAVLVCAAPALASVRQAMGASRLVVSFRLAARAR